MRKQKPLEIFKAGRHYLFRILGFKNVERAGGITMFVLLSLPLVAAGSQGHLLGTQNPQAAILLLSLELTGSHCPNTSQDRDDKDPSLTGVLPQSTINESQFCLPVYSECIFAD